MLAGFLPAEQDRFMLPLIRRAAEDQRLFLPDAGAGQIKTGIREGPAEVQPFGVGMEYIDGGVLRHCLFCIGEGIEQELIEFVVRHVVILDLPGVAFVVHVIGRVGHREVCELSVHQQGESVRLGTVAADEAVIAEQPQVTELRDDGLL